MKIPDNETIVFEDLVRGQIKFNSNDLDDQVLVKSNGIPTYHLAVVVDDHLMEITHIIRGAEWIVSTPVHLALYQALGWKPPIFMHTPLILGPDRAKLGKRHGAKNVLQYRDEGYLPEAINNFLFYLGFSYKDNSDILTMKEMVKVFNENKISKHNAIFDIQKLNYFNSKWIKKLTEEDLKKRLLPFVKSDWYESLGKILPLVKDRLTKLNDITGLIDFFFKFTTPTKEVLLENSQASPSMTLTWLNTVQASLENLSEFSSKSIHESLKKAQELSDLSPRQAFMSLRLAVTGKTVTPPLFETIESLGKVETLSRLKKSLSQLK